MVVLGCEAMDLVLSICLASNIAKIVSDLASHSRILFITSVKQRLRNIGAHVVSHSFEQLIREFP